MVRFFKKVLIFTIVALLILLGIVWISSFDNTDKYTSNNSNIISLRINSDFDSLDILFVGNSYCYSGIIPTMFDEEGLRTYNLGIATAGIEFYDIIVNDYLENIEQYPKTIFLLVSPMTFSSMSDKFSSYPVHRYLHTPLSNISVVRKYHRYNDLLPLYKKSLLKGISNILSQEKNDSSAYKRLYMTKGFIASDDSVSPEVVKKDELLYLPMLDDIFNQEKVQQFSNLIRAIDDCNIQLVLFEIPTNLLYNYFNDEYLINYKLLLEGLSKDYTVFVIGDSLVSDCNYRNIDHLNASGAKIVTRKLIETIKLNYLFLNLD